MALALVVGLGVRLSEALGVGEALPHPVLECRFVEAALELREGDAAALPEVEVQAESMALGLGLSEERSEAALLALGALPLGCALALAALLELADPSGPLEGVSVGALRLAPGEAVAPPGGGEAVAAPTLGKRGEGEVAEEWLPAALALRLAVLLAEGEAAPEGERALAVALCDWLALAQPLALALAGPVAQMPPSPLTSFEQPEELLCREAEAAALTEGLGVPLPLAVLLCVPPLALTLGAPEAAPEAEPLRVTEGAAEAVPGR